MPIGTDTKQVIRFFKLIDMNRQLYLTGCVLLTALAGCSVDDHGLVYPDGTPSATRCEILLSTTNLEVQQAQTRSEGRQSGVSAASNYGLAGGALPQGASTRTEQFDSDETVYVWADEVSTSGTAVYADIQAWALTADGSGGLTGGSRYFPANGSHSLDFYALHGNLSSVPTGALGSYTHTVDNVQTAPASRQTSDLLYATNQGVSASGGSWVAGRYVKEVPLNFKHLLAKVKVAITADVPSDLDDCTLFFNDGGGTLRVTPGKVAPATLTDPDVCAAMLGTHSPVSVQMAVEQVTSFSTTPESYGEAIVVPQAYSGRAMISVRLSGGGVLSFKPSSITLQAGKEYTFHVTVDSNGELRVTYILNPWGEGSIEVDPKPEVLAGATILNPWGTGVIEHETPEDIGDNQGDLNNWGEGSDANDA